VPKKTKSDSPEILDSENIAQQNPELDPATLAPDLALDTNDGETTDSKEKNLDPLETANAKADEYLETLQRLKAEFDNFRKRTDKERTRLIEIHQSTVLEKLLPTLDSFDAALQKIEPDQENDFVKGIRLVYEGLMDTLMKLGLERIETLGKPFDPEIAEALMTMPAGENEPDSVVNEIASGYRFKNRVLRPAKVIVAVEQDQSKNETVQEK